MWYPLSRGYFLFFSCTKNVAKYDNTEAVTKLVKTLSNIATFVINIYSKLVNKVIKEIIANFVFLIFLQRKNKSRK